MFINYITYIFEILPNIYENNLVLIGEFVRHLWTQVIDSKIIRMHMLILRIIFLQKSMKNTITCVKYIWKNILEILKANRLSELHVAITLFNETIKFHWFHES